MTPKNKRLWVPDYNRASNYKSNYPLTEHIFSYPNSFWLTGGPKSRKYAKSSVSRTIKRAGDDIVAFVLYAIPDRDIGQYSAGGITCRDEYLDYCKDIAKGVGNSNAILIIEPDAIPHSTHLERPAQVARLSLIREVTEIFKDCPNLVSYIDAGHSNWLTPAQTMGLLYLSGIQNVRGFSVNVSNFRPTDEALNWGLELANILPGEVGFVIDTSRNGVCPADNEWCNPDGMGLGDYPTFETDCDLCDAYLWVKVPGESDGKKNGSPPAGKFWPEYAEMLVKNKKF